MRYNTAMEPHERLISRQFYIVDYEDDVPREGQGRLIPAGRFHYNPRAIVSAIPVTNQKTGDRYWVLLVTYLSLFVMLALGTFQVIQNPSQLTALLPTVGVGTAPAVVIAHPYTNQKQELSYGVQVTFTEPYFFGEVRDGFIEAGQSFLEVQLDEMRIRYFEEGVLKQQFPIVRKGERGSWGEVPAGLYKVEIVDKQYFSVLGQVYLPSYIGFQGNLAIHGTPEQTPGEPVLADYQGGSIQLTDTDSSLLKDQVKAGLPILVFTKRATPDTFVYEPKIPDIPARQYLVADIGNSTVLASSELDEVASIASLTKLMTALVASEQLNLDRRVRTGDPSFVQSLVPRLGDRDTVSLYSLLQLLLIESSNEASEVIASQVGRERFIALMNERASALGMTNTIFADPSGLSADNQSTLRDLLRLTQHIYQTRSFILELSANQDLPTAYVKDEFGELLNFNLIKDDTTFIGGKIGETRAAGQTSVTLHRLTVRGEERTIVVIILGSESRGADVRQLLNYVIERFGAQ